MSVATLGNKVLDCIISIATLAKLHISALGESKGDDRSVAAVTVANISSFSCNMEMQGSRFYYK